MYDEIIEIYFDYWINEYVYKINSKKDKYYLESWEKIKKLNNSLEKKLLEENKTKELIELNDLFNSLIEIEREHYYKLGFKSGGKFMIELLEK
ncbi:hypothetical protein KGF47_18300 [Clostridioides sp. ZZV13-5731]|uniref:DUF6809 family protein n=1 Tax=unclassified Clostridioides TaxID=2635829 RepID=UPI001C18F8BF|nr:hypothetical protein [Clostridioides sp. ZZV15-6388]MCC0728564.1 hypothetical protein [Clostridioides sp. ZZV14-6045]MCC0752674.1 hypothetical protein [Clostridioides sp. ZZV13-5731]MDB2749261.1 hypothetical protein [Clostridioides difficile]HBG3326864.1 hypothetical protein [Clostridioides difficile]